MDHGQRAPAPRVRTRFGDPPPGAQNRSTGRRGASGWRPGAFDASIQPASVGLASFIGELSTPVQTVMSVAVMYTLPAVVFYLLAQKYIVSGMTAGGVKG